MTLQFSEASLPALQERLLARDIDIAVYGLSVPVDDARFDHLFLYRERFVVVVGTTHPLARCDAISFGDLKGETCLGIALDGSEHDEAPSTVATSPGPCRGREDWIMAMAAAGLGYGIVPEHAARPSGVVAFTPPSANLARDIVLATLPGEESAGVLAVKAHAARANWRGAQSQRTVDVELLALTETTAR